MKKKTKLKEDVFSMFEKEEDDIEELENDLEDVSFEIEFTPDEIQQKAEEMGIDLDEIDLDQLIKGVDHELEHIDVTDGDLEKTIMIAVAHLEEIPIYYDLLDKMEDDYFKEADEEDEFDGEDFDDEDFEEEE